MEGRASVLRVFAALAWLGLALGAASGTALAQVSVRGTAYDRLDLASPEAALRTFLGAYKAGDFVTVYWVFSPATQTAWQNQYFMLNFDRMLRNNTGEQLYQQPYAGRLMPAIAELEQQDLSFLFANILNVGADHHLLPLDLSGLPDDLSPAALAQLGAAPRPIPGGVEIALPLPAYPQPVAFRLERSPLGKWRVRQIIPPGGDETSLPWGLGTK